MSDGLLAAILSFIASLVGNIIQFIMYIKSRSESFISKIDDSGFTVYSDSVAPDEIWKDFSKDFKSYNDPWKMELASPEDYIELHKERYSKVDDSIFRFLFFIKNDLGQFERFVKFQSLVHLSLDINEVYSNEYNKILEQKINSQKLPESLRKIEVFLNRDFIPNQTFFRGWKPDKKGELQKVSLWYLSLDPNKDIPHMILKSSDARFWNELDIKWTNSRKNSEKILGQEIFKRYIELSRL